MRQLTKAGCKRVFRDVHVSGAKSNRAQLRRVIDQLNAGDVLMVTRLDRLARSTRDLSNRSSNLRSDRNTFSHHVESPDRVGTHTVSTTSCFVASRWAALFSSIDLSLTEPYLHFVSQPEQRRT